MMGIGKRKERMGRFLEGERKDIYIYIESEILVEMGIFAHMGKSYKPNNVCFGYSNIVGGNLFFLF